MNQVKIIYTLVLVVITSITLQGQHEITLDSSIILKGGIILNAPQDVLLDGENGYVIVPKKRITKLYYKSGEEITYNVVGLDLKMDQKDLPTGGGLITKGAGQMKAGIFIGLVGGALAGIMGARGMYVPAIAVGGVASVVSLSVNLSGLSNIQKGGRLLDAVRY
jgi:hypothetical protein